MNWPGGGDRHLRRGWVRQSFRTRQVAACAAVDPPHSMMKVITHIVLCGEAYIFYLSDWIRFDLLSFHVAYWLR
jgi:hypothetical protein